MIRLHFKQIWLTIVYLLLFRSKMLMALNICSGGVWNNNGTTIAGDAMGLKGSNSSMLNSPSDTYIDRQNNLYVLDSGNYRLQIFPPSSFPGRGQSAYTSTVNLPQIGSARRMSIDNVPNLYILDSMKNQITKQSLPTSKNITIVAGGDGNNISQLSNPQDMFIDPNSTSIWIADTNNHRIVFYPSSSMPIISYGTYGNSSNQFNQPNGLFVDTIISKVFYVADTYNHRIQMWSINEGGLGKGGQTVAGQIKQTSESTSMTVNQLFYPSALIVDTNGYIYILQTFNEQIIQWKTQSSFGTIILNGGLDFKGFATPNQLSKPSKFIFDQYGNLLVVDTNNNRIQKFSIICENNTSTMQTTSNSSNQSFTTTFSSTQRKSPMSLSNSSSTVSYSSINSTLSKSSETKSVPFFNSSTPYPLINNNSSNISITSTKSPSQYSTKTPNSNVSISSTSTSISNSTMSRPSSSSTLSTTNSKVSTMINSTLSSSMNISTSSTIFNSTSTAHFSVSNSSTTTPYSKFSTMLNTTVSPPLMMSNSSTTTHNSKVSTMMNTTVSTPLMMSNSSSTTSHSKVSTMLNTTVSSAMIMSNSSTTTPHSKVSTMMNTTVSPPLMMSNSSTTTPHSKVSTTMNITALTSSTKVQLNLSTVLSSLSRTILTSSLIINSTMSSPNNSTKHSFGSLGCYPQWFVIIICSIVLLTNK